MSRCREKFSAESPTISASTRSVTNAANTRRYSASLMGASSNAGISEIPASFAASFTGVNKMADSQTARGVK